MVYCKMNAAKIELYAMIILNYRYINYVSIDLNSLDQGGLTYCTNMASWCRYLIYLSSYHHLTSDVRTCSNIILILPLPPITSTQVRTCSNIILILPPPHHKHTEQSTSMHACTVEGELLKEHV